MLEVGAVCEGVPTAEVSYSRKVSKVRALKAVAILEHAQQVSACCGWSHEFKHRSGSEISTVLEHGVVAVARGACVCCWQHAHCRCEVSTPREHAAVAVSAIQDGRWQFRCLGDGGVSEHSPHALISNFGQAGEVLNLSYQVRVFEALMAATHANILKVAHVNLSRQTIALLEHISHGGVIHPHDARQVRSLLQGVEGVVLFTKEHLEEASLWHFAVEVGSTLLVQQHEDISIGVYRTSHLKGVVVVVVFSLAPSGVSILVGSEPYLVSSIVEVKNVSDGVVIPVGSVR